MEFRNSEEEEEIQVEEQKELEKDDRETIKASLKRYGYEEVGDRNTFLVFKNETEGLTVRISRYRDGQSWRFILNFYDGQNKVHTAMPVSTINVVDTIIRVEVRLVSQRMKTFIQNTGKSIDQQDQ